MASTNQPPEAPLVGVYALHVGATGRKDTE